RGAILVPLALVVARAREGVANGLFHAHARHRITPRRARNVEAVGAFHVFAERELDAGRRTLKDEVAGRVAVTKFEHSVLPADGVGRAVQRVDRGRAAGQLAIDVD